MSIKVTGASDDLIELDGDIYEEFPLHDDDDGDLLAFDNGVVLRVQYTRPGVWRITPVSRGDLVDIVLAPEGDDDAYTDVATLRTPATMVVHGIAFARATA